MRNVILEGCDGSGKSTLAKSLTFYLGMRVQEGEGPGKGQKELNERVDRYLGMTNTIFDRHPIISQTIYNYYREEAPTIQVEHLLKFKDDRSKYIIVYCEGDGLSAHKPKPDETADQLELVERNYPELMAHYQTWAIRNADIIYRLGQDMGLVGRMIKGGL